MVRDERRQAGHAGRGRGTGGGSIMRSRRRSARAADERGRWAVRHQPGVPAWHRAPATSSSSSRTNASANGRSTLGRWSSTSEREPSARSAQTWGSPPKEAVMQRAHRARRWPEHSVQADSYPSFFCRRRSIDNICHTLEPCLSSPRLARPTLSFPITLTRPPAS